MNEFQTERAEKENRQKEAEENHRKSFVLKYVQR